MPSILAGEISIAEAVRKEKVSEQSIGRCKAEFGEAGKTALIAGMTGPSSREEQLEAEVAGLTKALGEAAVEIGIWKKSGGTMGPLEDLEVIRIEAGMPTASQFDAIEAVEIALADYEAMFGAPLVNACGVGTEAGELLPVVTLVTDIGGPFRSFCFEGFITSQPSSSRCAPG